MSRAATAILSTENLIHNLNIIKQKAPGTKVIAMIKANGYGHGLRSTAQRLEKHVYSFGVASIDEAIALRNAGIKIPITLMGGVFEIDELLVASCQNFHVVIHEEPQIAWLQQINLPVPLKIWLKIDTGMGRLGLKPERMAEVHQLLSNNKNIVQPINVMSHLACADEPEHPLNKKQFEVFDKFTKNLPGAKSLAASPSIFRFPETTYDIIRPGISLYGISPFKHISAQELGLKPVMTLQTRLISVKHRLMGESIGYSARFTCPEDMPIGVIAMGYGDGYPRTARDGTPILVNNVRCQLAGRVSMDLITIDLRNCPNAKVGDPVILWGNGLPIEEVATYTENIPNDLLCSIQNRVKFHWTMNN